MIAIYEIPEDLDKLFFNAETEYRIIDYGLAEMDNFASMAFFCNLVGITDEDIEMNDGTQIIVKHINYPQLLVIDAGGLGDFHSHSFTVTEYNYG